MSNFVDEYQNRQAVLWTLNEINNMYGDLKTGKGKTDPKLSVILNSFIKEVDMFRMYGSKCQVMFTAWNKDKIPTSAILVPPDTNRTMYKKLLLADVLTKCITGELPIDLGEKK